MKIYFTGGKTEEWSRARLIEFVTERTKEWHYDDVADFIIYQNRMQSFSWMNDWLSAFFTKNKIANSAKHIMEWIYKQPMKPGS